MSHDITNFEKDVLQRSRSVPVLVDFWAEWCGPCRTLGPVLEKLAGEADGAWVLAKLDTEAFPDLAQKYGIQGIPNVKLFVDGEPIDEFVGALPESEVRRWLTKAIPSPHAVDLDEAQEQLERGAFQEAETKLRGVLEDEPQNDRAKVLLARIYLHTDPASIDSLLRQVGFDPATADQVEALETLANLVVAASSPGNLPESKVKSRYIEGVFAIKKGDWNAALEAMIEVLTQDRGFANQAAQTAGRAIFQLLSIRHPICEKHHRAFSGALRA